MASRFSLPSTAQLLQRRRLLERIAATPAIAITWIWGKPGSGKTSLAASWAETAEIPLWIDLDESDVEPSVLFDYLRRAASARRVDAADLPVLTVEHTGNLARFARRFCTRLAEACSNDLAVVVDNVHHLAAGEGFVPILNALAETLPEGAHIILVARTPPPPGCARLIANQAMQVLDGEDLRLDREETAAIARRHLASADAAVLDELHARCEGWVAGLVLLARTYRRVTPAERRRYPREPGVFDYFAAEILAAEPVALQRALMRLALLPEIDFAAAGALVDDASATTGVRRLYQANLFTERLETAGEVYRFHALFRAYLLHRLEEETSPRELAALRRLAAAQLQQAGDGEAAFDLYRRNGDWGEAAALLAVLAPVALQGGRAATLALWLQAFPDTWRTTRPWLLYWRGIADLALAPDAAQASLEKAYAAFDAEDDAIGRVTAWAGLIDALLLTFSDLSAAEHWIAQGQRLAALQVELPPPLQGLLVSRLCAISVLVRIDDPELPRLAAEARALLDRDLDPPTLVLVGSMLMQHYVWRGEHVHAFKLASDLATWSRAAPLIVKVTAARANHLYHWYHGTIAAGAAALDETIEQCIDEGAAVYLDMLRRDRSMGAAALGDAAKVRELLDLVGEPRRPVERSQHLYLQAWLHYHEGDDADAATLLEHALAEAQRSGVGYTVSVVRLAMAHVCMRRGERDAARALLDQVERCAAREASVWLHHHALLLRAADAFEHGDVEGGPAVLAAAFALGRAHARYCTDWWEPRMMAGLCARALELDIETRYAVAVVRMMQLVPPVPAAAPTNWPWPVDIRVLGGMEIRRDGETWHPGQKLPHRSLDLLQALIASGPAGCSAVTVLEDLWSSADGDAARGALKTAVHRLRRLLGSSAAIDVSEGWLRLNPNWCRVDAWEFERALDHAHQPGADDAALARAVARYGGRLFDGLGGSPRSLAAAESLHRRYVEAVVQLGRRWRESGDAAAVERLYRDCLAIDRLCEPVALALMEWYSAHDDVAAALAVHDSLTAALTSECDALPSPPVRRLAGKLRASGA